MTERNVINKVYSPLTIDSLDKDLRELGVKDGMTLIVHTSLSSLGWVCGGAEALILALIRAVGEEGTIVMPAQSASNSEPADWMNPPVPEEWWPIIRENMPAFCCDTTPTRGMGAVAELFRTFPGVVRSYHPIYSFAAWGKHKCFITNDQSIECGFGENSPLGKIYKLDGKILMLGVGHDSNTSFHLSEHASPKKERLEKSAALIENGERVWKTYTEIDYDSDCFDQIGFQFEQKEHFRRMKIGAAICKLFNQRDLVDFGRRWYKEQSN
ncbi:aminoglycoside N(3)-acetyltransferase [Guptibacillus hwajinpoensis]|uniref:aminoglycoside N(3)-acetyltransferase n=1 Tax=Guptibacillus hwajinpoensis TaxID=208199 RepID=UPI00384E5C76